MVAPLIPKTRRRLVVENGVHDLSTTLFCISTLGQVNLADIGGLLQCFAKLLGSPH